MGKLIRAALRIGGATVLVCALVAVSDQILAPAQPSSESAANDLLAGHSFYYAGQPRRALEAYRSAIARDPKRLSAWLNGAVVWAELGELAEASAWYRNALALNPESARIATALAEVELHRGQFDAAEKAVDHALDLDPKSAYAWIARGGIRLASGRVSDAVEPLTTAAMLQPSMTLAHYLRGRALELSGNAQDAGDAFAAASVRDSYFTSARLGLAESLMRQRRYEEAREQVGKLKSAAPVNGTILKLARALERNMRRDRGVRPARQSPKPPRAPDGPREGVSAPNAAVPILRVGIGTSGMGKPIPWSAVRFSAGSTVEIRDSAGKMLATARRTENWELRIAKGKYGRYLELLDDKGFALARSRLPILLSSRERDWIWIREPGSVHGLSRRLRGMIEVSVLGNGLGVVNAVDLESYTHGVLTAEMPINSPKEALKAQAVIARTHALFITNVQKKHRPQGYHLCDGQHCQVYRGVQAETNRSRRVVNETRGRVVSYQGRVANVLYSSNCGGHTQSSGEIRGWGEVPYFRGTTDGGENQEIPYSPWQLRQFLREPAQGYCAASGFVHNGHSRWSRVVSASELEARLDRHLGIGKLKGVVSLKRSRSGHLNSILVIGSKRSRIVDSEIRIRSLFGIGSQRSALFVFDTVRQPDGTPREFIFYGGGWGHGVGLCQSGAMGRAERGHSYAEILQAYYSGIEIGNLRY
ncbi:MAG: hypothetical protein CO113_02555 [Elusimicrobia bacterium CG_4_9_14_3_um_filter_62_55]|nr:MAG: hypothetical protein COR54_05110 [Elusimicrobia bacterium CG22_combo_CG10-13_8_21_14_all_63_91]PJA17745.1 MAG: hypothetical protein COX66_03535 [Elusimicrobia bacterium CG_4_10_14_0_2_um_filter_63_34]PJB26662.1 MAG: hypothetical protein CO113_02555 [Elusimicrobia bacterium CG_4_9_14_3_um_filter_62_55]